jgi:hypothetical protein
MKRHPRPAARDRRLNSGLATWAELERARAACPDPFIELALHKIPAAPPGSNRDRTRRPAALDRGSQVRIRLAAGAEWIPQFRANRQQFVVSSEFGRSTGARSSEQLPASANRPSCRAGSGAPSLTARIRRRHTKIALSAVRARRGTEGSNPFPSSGESTNFRFLSRRRPLFDAAGAY